MGLNGYQLFVRANNHGSVEEAIRAYVHRAGCGGIVDPEADEVSEYLAERGERQFVLSTIRDGMMAVWEDGSWADRGLARALSKSLGTRTLWLMMSDSTDSWAYAIYESGKELKREHRESDDPLKEAERFAHREHLPFALQYLEEPEHEDSEFWEELRNTGFFDTPADTEDIQRLLHDAPVEDVVVDDEEDEDDDWGSTDPEDDIEVMRGEFAEFTVECSRR